MILLKIQLIAGLVLETQRDVRDVQKRSNLQFKKCVCVFFCDPVKVAQTPPQGLSPFTIVTMNTKQLMSLFICKPLHPWTA